MTRVTLVLIGLLQSMFLMSHAQDYRQPLRLSLETLSSGGKANQKVLNRLWQTARLTHSSLPEQPQGVFVGEAAVRTIPEKSRFTHELSVHVQTSPELFLDQGLNYGVAFLPTHFRLSLRKGSTELLPKQEIEWKNGSYQYRFQLPTTADGVWEIKVDDFRYEEGLSLARWEQMQALAEAYPNEGQRAREVNTLLSQVNLENPEQLDTVVFMLADVRKTLEQLSVYAPFSRWGDDPLRLQILQQKYQNLRETLDQINQDRYMIYYQQGQKALTEDRINDALTAFDKATAYNPDFLPPYQEMARLAYLSGDFDEAAYHLEYLWHHPDLEEDLQGQVRALFYDIYYFFQQSAGKEAAQLKFAEAIVFLDKAAQLCVRIPARNNCDADIKTRKDRIHDGAFEYLIANARQSMYEDQFARALRLIQDAKAYQLQNALTRNSEYFSATVQEMFDLTRSRAAETLQESTAKDALPYLKFSESLQEDYPDLTKIEGTDTLYPAVYQAYYAQRMDDLKAAITDKRWEQALDLSTDIQAECNRYQTYIQADSIQMQQQTQAIYQGFITQAQAHLNEKNYRDALEDLRMAEQTMPADDNPDPVAQAGILQAYLGLTQRAYQDKAGREAFGFLTRAAAYLPDDPDARDRKTYESLRESIMPFYAQQALQAAEQAIKSGKKTDAKDRLQDVQALQDDYGWIPDKALQKRIRNLGSKLR